MEKTLKKSESEIRMDIPMDPLDCRAPQVRHQSRSGLAMWKDSAMVLSVQSTLKRLECLLGFCRFQERDCVASTEPLAIAGL